jgi:(4S)-4-hydroxy-5-phosphonooxypentane-2,3-dione isomerase
MEQANISFEERLYNYHRVYELRYERKMSMHIVLVYVHVKPEYVEAFKEASLDNARNSVQEAGIARFDVIQQVDDPTRFVLVEVYRSKDAPAKHRETAHYQRWRDTVADMMVEDRTRQEYVNIFPDDGEWG